MIAAGIAGIGVFVAWRQWVTAHQKIVLELYDRRYAAFESIVKSLVPVWRNGGCSQQEFFDFANAMERCRFIFGNDVFEFLTILKNDLAWLSSFDDQTINASNERQKLIAEKYKRLRRITQFYETGLPIFEPYMKLDQKMRGFFWMESANVAKKQIVLVAGEAVEATLKGVQAMGKRARINRKWIK